MPISHQRKFRRLSVTASRTRGWPSRLSYTRLTAKAARPMAISATPKGEPCGLASTAACPAIVSTRAEGRRKPAKSWVKVSRALGQVTADTLGPAGAAPRPEPKPRLGMFGAATAWPRTDRPQNSRPRAKPRKK